MSKQPRKRGRSNHPTPPALLVTAGAGSRLVLAAPDPVGVDTEARTITGIVVPFGKAGETSGGRLKFSAGSLTYSDPRRVKLLREHDQREVLGYATELTDTDTGLSGTFYVPEGAEGDRALAEAHNGLRDGLSVGVQLDDATHQRLRRAQAGAVIDARGQLREVSQVSVPAFDDARVAAASGADLVVSSWTTPQTTSAAGAGTPRGNTVDNTTPAGGTVTASDQTTTTTTAAAAAGDPQAPAVSTDPPQSAPPAPSSSTAPAAPAAAAGPVTVAAVAGAATVTSSPATYTLAGGGESLVRDLFNSAVRGDGQARDRVDRFNAELRDGNPATVAALLTAAATTTDVDGQGTDLPPGFGGGVQQRPDLMRALVDVRRPFVSRLARIPISDPRPFAIPQVGEFTGVGDHTEGTPHRPAGTLTLEGSDVVQPKATSGAWEVSRELIDSSNPALDAIAVRAMARDYARQSEGKVMALFAALATQAPEVTRSVDTLIELRAALLAFVNDDEEGADLLGISKGLLGKFLTELDTTNRAQIPFVQPANTVGTMPAGYVGFSIDGLDAFRASRIDSTTGLGGTFGVMARSQGILWAESPLAQFRFDEVLGPGVIKLALWAYSGAAIIDTADVQLITSAA